MISKPEELPSLPDLLPPHHRFCNLLLGWKLQTSFFGWTGPIYCQWKAVDIKVFRKNLDCRTAPPPLSQAVYLGVSDIWHLDRLRKRQSQALLTCPVLFSSILFHFWGEAGHPGSVLSSLSTLSTYSLLFYNNVEEPLLAQELESLTPPC